MKKNPWITILVLIFVFGTLFVFILGSSAISLFGERTVRVASKNSILHLELDGVIYDSKKFLKNLLKYKKNDKIKAIVISINSPGGVVGPSQEIYEEVLRIKNESKKPVIVHSSSLLASGAYYVAVAGDKIVVQPGTLVGSIGVIMEFVNLEKLYDWAKVQRFTITTGKYKDSGAEYRSMRDDERALFQEMINDTWAQFKEAVSKGRNLDLDFVTQYADGRVFTGSQAVKLGFADRFGTLEDAYEEAAKDAKLGADYEVFEPPKYKKNIFDLLVKEDDEETSTNASDLVSQISNQLLKTKLANKPLYLMPGAF